MNRKERSEEKKIQTIEKWIQTYANEVLQLATIYTSTPEAAGDVTVNTFVHAYRRMDLAHVYLTERNAVYGGVVSACRGFDAAKASDTRHATRTNGWDERELSDVEGQEEEQQSHMQRLDARREDSLTQASPRMPDGPRMPGGLGKVQLEPPAKPSAPDMSSGMESILSAVRRLSPELRIVLLFSTLGQLTQNDMSRILLLPKRMISRRLRTSWEQIHSVVDASATGDVKQSGLPDMLVMSVQDLVAGEALMTRIHKVVSATIQEVKAERRHRGPRWLKYATIATGLFSLAAVDMGFYATKGSAPPVSVATSPAQQTPGLPGALSGLPVTTEYQYALSSLPDTTSLNHMAMSNSGVYLPTLQQSPNAWPSIEVKYAPYTAAGASLNSALQSLSSIDMVPPIQQKSAGASLSSEWRVVSWRFDVTGQWAVASVNWVSGQSQSAVTQVYLLYLPSGASNLVLSIGDKHTDQASPVDVVVAAGDGRLIVQKAVTNTSSRPSAQSANQANSQTSSQNATNQATGSQNTASSHVATGGTENLVGLPVDVYQLSGTSPLGALGQPQQVPAQFGLMQKPGVFPSGILFMGVAGQPSNANEANTTWSLMSWNGDLTQFVGPPIDGQRHFAVSGTNNDLWWAETTPNQGAQADERWQVLMSPLSTDSVGQAAALNLDAPVAWFGAYNNRVAWVQDTDGQMQLVVALVK